MLAEFVFVILTSPELLGVELAPESPKIERPPGVSIHENPSGAEKTSPSQSPKNLNAMNTESDPKIFVFACVTTLVTEFASPVTTKPDPFPFASLSPVPASAETPFAISAVLVLGSNHISLASAAIE